MAFNNGIGYTKFVKETKIAISYGTYKRYLREYNKKHGKHSKNKEDNKELSNGLSE